MNEDTLVEFSVTPLGAGESVGAYVASCVRLIESSGLEYELHAMGTILEGSLDDCFEVVKNCVREVLKGNSRVTAAIKLDLRPGRRGRIRSKVESVRKRLK